MFYPSNNWYVVRQNMVGIWQVEAQQGCFYIPCPSRYMACQVRDYLMTWLKNSHFYRLQVLSVHQRLYLVNKITFEQFYEQVKNIHFADEDSF